MRRLLIFVASLVALPAMAHAQGRGMSAMARPAVAAPMAAPHVVMHAAQPSAAHVTSGSHVYTGYPRFVRTRSGAIVARPAPRAGSPIRNNGSAGSGRPLLSQDIVPGLGFDYAHVAATHPNGIHDRNRNRVFSGAFVPFFYGGGYYMPLGADDVEEAPAAEAQADTGSAGYSEPAQPPTRSRDAVPQNYASSAQAAPEPESEQYVFVRRDGTLFFAVAYSWENGTLRYITTEGVRRTLAGDKIDLDATQQFNEQRGLNFHLPA